MGWYSRLIVGHPFVLIVVNVALAFVLGPLTVFTIGLPDFNDPQQGFAPRSSKVTTWEKISDNILTQLRDLRLSYYPQNYAGFSLVPEEVSATENNVRRKRAVTVPLASEYLCLYETQAFPDILDAKIIVQSKTNSTILTSSNLRSICRLSDMFASYPWPAKSCYIISLPLYVKALNNRTSCSDITDADVSRFLSLLQRCAPYYFNGALQPSCAEPSSCQNVPSECSNLAAVYIVMHFLTDDGFLRDGNVKLTRVDFSAIIIPNKWYAENSDLLLTFYQDTLEDRLVEDGDITIPALQMDIEDLLFSVYIKRDVQLYVIAMAIVVIVMLVYMQSFVLVMAVVLNVIITLCLAYFVYYYVIQLSFFPFINLIAALLLIAISADDVFIIYDLWRQQIRTNPDSSYEEIMSETLRKGGLSIFVTSLTTAASLMANVASKITVVRCFGVFAGICILVNFILMITWIPALIVLIEKAFAFCMRKTSCSGSEKCSDKVNKASDYFWGVIVMKIISAAAPLWIVLLLVAGSLGLVVVFYKPGLKLPESNYVSVFKDTNPFEVYRRQFQDRIRYEQQLKNLDTISLVFFWGVDGVDNGDTWDPNKPGTLEFLPLDIYSAEARSWHNGFCQRLKSQAFVVDSYKTRACYFEVIQSLMTGPCVLRPDNQAWRKEVDLSPCCELHEPLNKSMIAACITYYMNITGGFLFRLTGDEVLGEVIFDKGNNVKLFTYSFESTMAFTVNYFAMDDFVTEVSLFAEKEQQTAPEAVKDFWFASYSGFELVFYDIQRAISDGTMAGIGISLVCSFLVLLATSLNVVISLFAIVTIALIIGATVGTLVLIGWELNVIESLTITMSLGLAVDFTIHYGVAYKLEKSNSRHERVKETVKTVSSAVSMAALTTFISGASVLKALVLPFRQFGLFLVFVMCYSWIFSTFLFLPLCYRIGPLGHTGDIGYLFRSCRRRDKDKEKKKPTASMDHTPRSNSNSGQHHIRGLTNLDSAYFRRPGLPTRYMPFDRHHVDSKFRGSPQSVFHVESPSRTRYNRKPFHQSNQRLYNGDLARHAYDGPGLEWPEYEEPSAEEWHWRIEKSKRKP